MLCIPTLFLICLHSPLGASPTACATVVISYTAGDASNKPNNLTSPLKKQATCVQHKHRLLREEGGMRCTFVSKIREWMLVASRQKSISCNFPTCFVPPDTSMNLLATELCRNRCTRWSSTVSRMYLVNSIRRRG